MCCFVNLAIQTDAFNKSLIYDHDLAGRVETIADRLGHATRYEYDERGNVLRQVDAKGGVKTFTSVSELSGRTVSYSYDDLYRLTNETIANDPHSISGSVGYNYDAVGNRLSRTSTVTGVPTQTSTFDANDRLNSDTYDPNGNTTASNSNSYAYDFENRLTSLNNGALTFIYDGDGNRVAKTVAGVTTNYLVDTNNHTGYAQVVEELQSGTVVKQFTYGHDLISQRIVGGLLSFYSYDGHGSVRQLTDATTSVTDTYDYDAFGILLHRTGTTPNDYLYAGEQFDAHLGFYYVRARYINLSTGRFWTMDAYEGNRFDPISLHKYLYVNADPVNNVDPTGEFALVDKLASLTINTIVSSLSILGRVVPALYVASSRLAYWYFANQTRIEFYHNLTAAALAFVETGTRLLLNNEEPVRIVNDNPGDWVEERLGANATGYELIDDLRDGNAMSIKTNHQNIDRLIREIQKEAETLGNRNSDFQPRDKNAALPKLPISSVQTRTLMVAIPETNAGFLRNPTFVQAVRQIQNSTRVIINVVPLRGWRR